MVQRFLFFNSTINDDRVYFAQDFADYFSSTHESGLLHPFNQPQLGVSIVSGMTVSIDYGLASIRGHYYENTAPTELDLPIADATYNRIDRIVLRLDSTHNERNILLHVKSGNAAATPAPPQLTRDGFIYELSLAQILVRANTTQLNQSDLTDERKDENVCGPAYLTLPIPPEQIQAVMDAWFADQDKEMFLKRSDMGVSNGLATLGANNRLTPSQGLDYVPKTEKGANNGVAPLGADGRVPNKFLGYYSPSTPTLATYPPVENKMAMQGEWMTLLEMKLPVSGRFRYTGNISRQGSGLTNNVKIELRKLDGTRISATQTSQYFNNGDVIAVSLDTTLNVLEGNEILLCLTSTGGGFAGIDVANSAIKGAII